MVWGRIPKYKPLLDFKEGIKIPVLNISCDPVFDGDTKLIKEKHFNE